MKDKRTINELLESYGMLEEKVDDRVDEIFFIPASPQSVQAAFDAAPVVTTALLAVQAGIIALFAAGAASYWGPEYLYKAKVFARKLRDHLTGEADFNDDKAKQLEYHAKDLLNSFSKKDKELFISKAKKVKDARDAKKKGEEIAKEVMK